MNSRLILPSGVFWCQVRILYSSPLSSMNTALNVRVRKEGRVVTNRNVILYTLQLVLQATKTSGHTYVMMRHLEAAILDDRMRRHLLELLESDKRAL